MTTQEMSRLAGRLRRIGLGSAVERADAASRRLKRPGRRRRPPPIQHLSDHLKRDLGLDRM